MKPTLIAGFDKLFKKTELNLPCVVSVRDFDVFQVVKQLADALDIRAKFWQWTDGITTSHGTTHYYAILFEDRITGIEINRLVQEFENRS
jgi:hypothetical protein